MRIAYNPITAAALTTAPANNDITFDLKGLNIFVRGVKFKGTDTTYSVFKKHTSSSGGGYNGLVPVPSYTSTNTRFLREDGSWVVPTNTDNKVTLGNTTTSNFRPIILGYNNSTDPNDLSTSITLLVYTTTSIYAQPSTGSLWANKIYSNGFFKNGSSDNQVLLGGGGSKDLTDFDGVEYLKYHTATDPNAAYRDKSVKWFTLSSSGGYAGNSYGFPVSNNANGILWVGTHWGNYGHQLGFSSNGNIYTRYISAGSFPTLTNGASWKKLAWIDDITWSNLKNKPTTLSGYGITDILLKGIDLSATTTKDMNYLTYNFGGANKGDDSSQKNTPTSYGRYLSLARSNTNSGGQLYFDTTPNGAGDLYQRTRQAGNNNTVNTWRSWRKIWDSGNLNPDDFSSSDHTHSNYVTTNTSLTISGIKTFTTLQKFTVASGTSPFTVTSTTKVVNLNADLLDGVSNGSLTAKYFNYSVSITWDCNNPEYTLYSNYGAAGSLALNSPYGWHYGLLFTIFKEQSTESSLAAQFIWDVLHNTTNPGILWFRTKDGINGWNKNWGRLAYITDNVASATKLQTPHSINGTDFDGTKDIVTSYWGTSRNITIGNTTRAVNGSTNIVWSLSDIGVASSDHTHYWANIKVSSTSNAATSPTFANTYITGTNRVYASTSDTTHQLNLMCEGTYAKIQSNGSIPLAINPDGNNVGIGLTNPSYTLHVDGTLGVVGKLYTTLAGSTRNLLIVPGGEYIIVGSIKGYLKITLPVSWNATMMRFDVFIYNYTTNEIYLYSIGGYNYTSGNWVNTSAYSNRYQLSNKGNLTVRFGHDGSKCCVYIGESDTTWSYPLVVIRNVLLGHSGGTKSEWSGTWNIRFTTKLADNIDTVVENPAINYRSNKADTLTTARTINGTSFDGSTNITTANWGTTRTLTIGNTGKSVNGSGNVSWTLAEIGAAASSHTHNYIPLTGTGTTKPVTGTVWFKDVDAIKINSNNKDINIWEVVGNAGSYNSQFGFNLKYIGTGSNNDNSLKLYSHNKTGTPVEVREIKLDGIVYNKTTNYFSNGITLQGGHINFNANSLLQWNGGTYQQKITITDDSSANTAVFNFQQSTNTGSSWTTLASIYDNGYIYANGFRKNNSSNKKVLLGDGTDKNLSDFSMAHSHPYLPLAGGTMNSSAVVRFPYDGYIIQNSLSTSNYTAFIKWYKGGSSQDTYDPQIGQHNTGGSGGSITILPYPTETDPWSGNVGLFLAKNTIRLDGKKVWFEGNHGANSGLDADLLDGKHASSFMLKTEEITNNVTIISKSLTLSSSSWVDTGIAGDDLTTGTYILLLYINDDISFYSTYHSGVMSWFTSNTNDSEADEIILHRAGHAYHKTIYLRTLQTSNGKGGMKLLIAASDSLGTTAKTFTFKFKRII